VNNSNASVCTYSCEPELKTAKYKIHEKVRYGSYSKHITVVSSG